MYHLLSCMLNDVWTAKYQETYVKPVAQTRFKIGWLKLGFTL